MAEDEKKLVRGVSFPELVKTARELEGQPARAPGPDTVNCQFGDGEGVAIFLPKYRDMSYSEILAEIARVEKVRVMSAALGYPGVKEGQPKPGEPVPVVFPRRQKGASDGREKEAPGKGDEKTAPVFGAYGDYAERTAKPEPVMFRQDAGKVEEAEKPGGIGALKKDKPSSAESRLGDSEQNPASVQDIPKTAQRIGPASRADTERERAESSKLRGAELDSRGQVEPSVSRQVAELIKKESPDLRTKEITGRANERLLPEAPRKQNFPLFSISESAIKEPAKAGPAPEGQKPGKATPPAIEIRPPKVVVRKEPESPARAGESKVAGSSAGGRGTAGEVAGRRKELDGPNMGGQEETGRGGKMGREPKAKEGPLSARDNAGSGGKPGFFQGIAGLLKAGAKKDPAAGAKQEAPYAGAQEQGREIEQLEKIGAYWREQGGKKKDDPMERLKQYRKKRREEWDEK